MHASSVLAGTLGALASVFGKLGFDAQMLGGEGGDGKHASPHVVLLQRVACIGLMLVCNAAMTSLFVQSLHQSGSLLATVINTSVSFVLTGVAGRVVFHEPLSMQWWTGASLTLVGVALLAGCAPKDDDDGQCKTAPLLSKRRNSTPPPRPPPLQQHAYNTRRRSSTTVNENTKKKR